MRRILLWLTRSLMSVSLAALALRAALLALFLRLTASTLSTLMLASTAALATVFALLAHLRLNNSDLIRKTVRFGRSFFMLKSGFARVG